MDMYILLYCRVMCSTIYSHYNYVCVRARAGDLNDLVMNVLVVQPTSWISHPL